MRGKCGKSCGGFTNGQGKCEAKELNRLVQEKVVVKVIGRPVYYFDAKILQELSKTRLEQYEVTTLKNSIRMQETIGTDAFLHVIGSDGSLKTVIKKAKAAMIYPPFGLHTAVDWSYRSRKDNVRGNHVSLCQGTRCIR